MTNETELLKEISHKLSQLIVLTKLSNSKIIAETKEEIRKDPVSRALLDFADGTLSSGQLTDKVMQQVQTSERTVKRRISDLTEKGALISTRKGNEVYYENSGLYD